MDDAHQALHLSVSGFCVFDFLKKNYFIYYFAVCAKLYHVLHLHNGTQ